jgi:hypothetical protein
MANGSEQRLTRGRENLNSRLLNRNVLIVAVRELQTRAGFQAHPI